jgi:hypothetical protein
MKRLCVMLGLAFAASSATAQAQDQSMTVHWQDIVGVITAQGVNNPVSDHINSGTFAWTTSGGAASVNLANGATKFAVEGLVINGTQFSGTPGPVTAVTGTLVCNPGDQNQELALDTAVVPLDAHGTARFSGPIHSIPGLCSNPLFLVRIAIPAGAAGSWIATGAVRTGDPM